MVILQTYFSFESRAEQQMEVYLRYGQHPELYSILTKYYNRLNFY